MAETFPPPLSVLVVEDQDDAARSAAELLALCGHTVRVAACGADALREAAAVTPDVVLLDIGLPGMDGWEVARRLRDQASGGRQPFIVAVTGYATDGDRWRSAGSGVDVHLAKPADPAALTGLVDWVQRVLAGHRAGADGSLTAAHAPARTGHHDHAP